MIKYLGGALLTVAGLLLGNSIYRIYNERIAVLEYFHAFLVTCESEISFYKTEFSAIIDKFRKENGKYDNIIFVPSNNSFLISKQNKKLVDSFCMNIGKLDSETQKYVFIETKEKTLCAIENAKKDLLIKGKMYKKLSPIVALGLFILFL